MRPTTSKVKLAIISMLGSELIQNSTVLDLFAGTGSVGIELSKLGAKKVVMIEKNIKQYSEIKEKVKSFKDNSLDVIKGDVFSLLPKLNYKFNIIFADPPYEDNSFDRLCRLINKSDITSENALILYEHYKKNDTPNNFANFKKIRDKIYGDTRLSIFKKVKGDRK